MQLFVKQHSHHLHVNQLTCPLVKGYSCMIKVEEAHYEDLVTVEEKALT